MSTPANPAEPHGEGFDESKVPDGPAGDWFFSGRTGAGLSNDQFDTMKQRWLDAGLTPPWEDDDNTIERGSE